MIIHLMGNLGAEPEVRFTSTGQKVTTLRLACRARKGKEEATVWWRATIWGDQFDRMMPYMKAGSSVCIVAEMRPPEIYMDREQQPRVSMECTVIHLSFSPFGKGTRKDSEEGGAEQHGHEEMGTLAPSLAHAKPVMSAPMSGSTHSNEVPF